MPYAIYDVDGTIIDELGSITSYFKKKFEETEIYPSPYPLWRYRKLAFLIPSRKVLFYSAVCDMLKELCDVGIQPVFITARPKMTNPFTVRQLKQLFYSYDIKNTPIIIKHSNHKFEEFRHLYKRAKFFFEDSPEQFPKLFSLNNNGILIVHEYNKRLVELYPHIYV